MLTVQGSNPHRMNRRDLLKGAAGAGLGMALGPLASSILAESALAQPDLIRAENEKAGTTDWMLSKTQVDPKAKYRCPWIEGYCSRTSLRPGELLEIMVSTNPPSPFVIDLYRLGYYGGKGGRHLGQLGPFKGRRQPDPEIGEERLRECLWEPATKIVIPKDWVSGVYLGKLTAEKEGLQSYVIFIVRDDRACDFLFQSSDTTWSAYNRWPSTWSLYDDGTNDEDMYVGPGVRVSWDRPYGKYRQVLDQPLSQGSGSFLLWEFPLAYWMEREAYDVSYISNVDTHADGKGLLRAKAWLSVGHDEYWSLEMFDNVKAAVAAGVNAAFFSGDICWGVIPFLPSGSGAPHRVISRIGMFGPIDERDLEYWPELLKFKLHAPTEATLIGARNIYPYNGTADWICTDESHWIYEGTGMRKGDTIPGLVGFEWMGHPAEIPGLRVVARGIVRKRSGQEGEYTATIYPGPKENFVFNAASIWWSDGLTAPPGYIRPSKKLKGPDPRVQRITANLFNRFRGQF
jgi:hypothetical protein